MDDGAQLNLVAAWIGILLGFLSGMLLGLGFHREDWLGGYGSFQRRLYRLAHIACFGLGAANLGFALTVRTLATPGPLLPIASCAWALGAVTMPLCCVLMAHRPGCRAWFAVPVLSLTTGALLTLAELLRL